MDLCDDTLHTEHKFTEIFPPIIFGDKYNYKTGISYHTTNLYQFSHTYTSKDSSSNAKNGIYLPLDILPDFQKFSPNIFDLLFSCAQLPILMQIKPESECLFSFLAKILTIKQE